MTPSCNVIRRNGNQYCRILQNTEEYRRNSVVAILLLLLPLIQRNGNQYWRILQITAECRRHSVVAIVQAPMTLEMVIQRYRDSHTDGWSFDHGRHFRKQDNETTLWCFNFLPTYFCLSAANLSVDVEHKIWETNCGKLVRQYTCTVFNTLLVQHPTQIIRLLGYLG